MNASTTASTSSSAPTVIMVRAIWPFGVCLAQRRSRRYPRPVGTERLLSLTPRLLQLVSGPWGDAPCDVVDVGRGALVLLMLGKPHATELRDRDTIQRRRSGNAVGVLTAGPSERNSETVESSAVHVMSLVHVKA